MIEEEKPSSDISSTESPAPEPNLSSEDLASIKLSRLLLHLSAIGQASDLLIQGARATGASGYQTLVLSQHLMNLARTVGAAGRAFADQLPKKS